MAHSPISVPPGMILNPDSEKLFMTKDDDPKDVPMFVIRRTSRLLKPAKSPKRADEPMSDEELKNEKKFHEAETERD